MATIKPTILAFHGSGSNGTIHTIQLARVARLLKSQFEFVSLTAPIQSAAGPGILPFFDGCGPYYRWIPPNETTSITTSGDPQLVGGMLPAVEDLIRTTVSGIRAKGGRVVGAVGFSQGTKVVAGLLKATEIRELLAKEGRDAGGLEWLDFKFGISVCSGSPPILVPSCVTDALSASGLAEEERKEVLNAKISLPTLHVIGEQDEYRWAGKVLVESAYATTEEEVKAGKVGLYEFDIGHHYPTEPEHTQKMVDWILNTWDLVK